MINIAMCNIPESINRIHKVIGEYANKNKLKCSLYIYSKIDNLISSGIDFKIFFLNKREKEFIELDIEEYIKCFKSKHFKQDNLKIIVYVDNPISEEDSIKSLKAIKPYLLSSNTMEFITDQGIKDIDINDIDYFEYKNRKVVINTVNNNFIISDKISNIYNMMKPFGFAVPHKSFVVNLLHIKQIKNYNISIGNVIIPLSQKRSSKFRKFYEDYVSSHIRKINEI